MLMMNLRESCPEQWSEARIRRRAAEIGAGETEIVELLLERMEPPVNAVRPIPIPKESEPTKKRVRAVTSDEIGSLGQALLQAHKRSGG